MYQAPGELGTTSALRSDSDSAPCDAPLNRDRQSSTWRGQDRLGARARRTEGARGKSVKPTLVGYIKRTTPGWHDAVLRCSRARVVKGIDLKSTAGRRTGSNPVGCEGTRKFWAITQTGSQTTRHALGSQQGGWPAGVGIVLDRGPAPRHPPRPSKDTHVHGHPMAPSTRSTPSTSRRGELK